MSARVIVALGLLAAGIVVPIVFAPAVLYSWTMSVAGLALLARLPEWRRPARTALAVLGALVFVGLFGAGAVIAFRETVLVRAIGLPGEAVWATFAMIAGALSTGVLLVLAPGRGSRLFARAAAACFALMLLSVAVVATGEKVAGLIGLFGSMTVGFVGAALVVAMAGARASGN